MKKKVDGQKGHPSSHINLDFSLFFCGQKEAVAGLESFAHKNKSPIFNLQAYKKEPYI